METTYFSNLKRYNSKGQRLGIFCRQKSENMMEVFVLRCSRKDHFNKDVARKAYIQYLETGGENGSKKYCFHPEIFDLQIDNGKPKSSFLRWCNNNTYKLENGLQEVKCKFLTRGETLILK